MIYLNIICILLSELSDIPLTGDEGIPKWVFIVMAVSIIAIIALIIFGRINDKKRINDLQEVNKDNDINEDNTGNQRTQL